LAEGDSHGANAKDKAMRCQWRRETLKRASAAASVPVGVAEKSGGFMPRSLSNAGDVQ
jgi:hypothetical protein